VTRVAVLGAGHLGTAIASALIASGHEVAVWNRTPEKAAALVERGAREARTPGEAFESEVVFVCLSDYSAGRRLLESGRELIRGKTVVLLTSGTPDDIRGLEAWCEAEGVRLLAGMMLVYPSAVGGDESRFVYAGRAGAFDAARDILAALGGSQRYVGAPAGALGGFVAAFVEWYYFALVGFAHASVVARGSGISSDLVHEELVAAMGGVVRHGIDSIAEELRDGAPTSIEATISTGELNMKRIADYCVAAGIDHRLPLEFHRVLARAVDAGLEASSIGAVAGMFSAVRAD